MDKHTCVCAQFGYDMSIIILYCGLFITVGMERRKLNDSSFIPVCHKVASPNHYRKLYDPPLFRSIVYHSVDSPNHHHLTVC